MLLTPTAPGYQDAQEKQSWTGPLFWVLELASEGQGAGVGLRQGLLSIQGEEPGRGCLGSHL